MFFRKRHCFFVFFKACVIYLGRELLKNPAINGKKMKLNISQSREELTISAYSELNLLWHQLAFSLLQTLSVFTIRFVEPELGRWLRWQNLMVLAHLGNRLQDYVRTLTFGFLGLKGHLQMYHQILIWYVGVSMFEIQPVCLLQCLQVYAMSWTLSIHMRSRDTYICTRTKNMQLKYPTKTGRGKSSTQTWPGVAFHSQFVEHQCSSQAMSLVYWFHWYTTALSISEFLDSQGPFHLWWDELFWVASPT